MYKAVHFDDQKNVVHIWGDGQHNDAGHQTFPWKKYAYINRPDGEYKTIDGYKCTKIYQWSKEAEDMGLIYEHDLPVATRFLIDKYTDSDEIAKDQKILYLDIEVEKGERYSQPFEALNPINAISYFSTGDEYYTCLLLDYNRQPQILQVKHKLENGNEINIKIFTYSSEEMLLMSFLEMYSLIEHNIITGWNCMYYDMPYLYNRIYNNYGKKYAAMLSSINIVRKDRPGDFNEERIKIAGVSILDYLMLYKNFTYSEKSNYRLDTIAKHELGRGKVQYDGDLDYLYKHDIKKYAIYNVVDVELIVALDNKLKYIDSACGICHAGHVPYEDIYMTSRYLDGAAILYCKRNNVVASTHKSDKSSQAIGAYVKMPKPGLYKWVYDLDLTSLYPMTMITLNISPETKFGKIDNWDEEWHRVNHITSPDTYIIRLFKDKTILSSFNNLFSDQISDRNSIEIKVFQLKDFMDSYNLAIASNGILYDQSKKGIIPSILSTWFDDRKKYKDLRKKYEKEGDEDLILYYDKKQYIVKIMLNSFYGVLLMPGFRFYDKDQGEAVTLTGQSVIKHATKAGNYYYNKIIGTDNIDYSIYSDTDSLFMSVKPLLEYYYGNLDEYSEKEIIDKAKPVISEVQTFINNSYLKYAEIYHNVLEHRWDIKQELIAKVGFWVGKKNTKGVFEGVKKRYALWIVDKEGKPTSELEVKGLDSVRSSFPLRFSKFMNEILDDILNGKTKDDMNEKVTEFKKSLDNIPLYEIMNPVGVKNMLKYDVKEDFKFALGTPVHVKAAMAYNSLLNYHNITNTNPIFDGDKILWCYLKQNPYNLEVIAIKGFEDPKIVLEFVEKYIDRNKIFDTTLNSKLVNFWLSLNWGAIQTNDIVNLFFKFT